MSTVMTATRLRPMQQKDLAAVYQLEQICQPTPWSPGFFRHLLRTHASGWVIVKARKLIGFGIVQMVQDKAHIMNMCVAPAHRQQGLGRRIMLQLLAVARHHHADYVWLEVHTTNRRAILLYRKLGFRAALVRKGYYPMRHGRRRDALIMAYQES